ncbi:MAG: NTP transferase domain-containing protein [Bacteroidales bacterium]
MTPHRVLIIPAAGRGSRLGVATPKVLYPVNGVAMLDHLLALYARVVDRIVVVVGPAAEQAVRDHVAPRATGRQPADVDVDVQATPTGMLDAILVPHPRIVRLQPTRVWISWGDQVAVHPRTVERLAEEDGRDAALVFPTATVDDPYIHLARADDGRITRILQRREGDPMPARGESDMGLFSLRGDAYVERLTEFARGTAEASGTGERNFLPFISWLSARAPVATFPCTETIEARGVNTPDDLRLVEEHLRRRGDR